MREDNKIVHSLWISPKLGVMEIMTLKSFIKHGHTFYLWTYSDLRKEVPDGVVLKDANEIMSFDKVFRYEKSNEYGHGKGSYAGFVDIFRCKLIYEKGGWWVDMDSTCLKPLNFKAPYVFRRDKGRAIANNIFKCPPKSSIMEWCYENTNRLIHKDNKVWMLPSAVLRLGIEKFSLDNYVNSNICNPDRWEQIALYLNRDVKLPLSQNVIHWTNESWSRVEYRKEEAIPNTLYALLLKQYNLEFRKITCTATNFDILRWKLKLFVLKKLPKKILAFYFERPVYKLAQELIEKSKE